MRLIDITKGKKLTAVVRGGGDLATGVIYRLWQAGFRVLCTEIAAPTAVRRSVAVAEAVYNGTHAVQGMEAVLIRDLDDFDDDGRVAVIVDPQGESIYRIAPDLVVDAIVAKVNLGTTRDMARLVLALGPGFSAPQDVHAVIETKRGHYLGQVITEGRAIANTGIPGMEMGYTVERVLRAPASGSVKPKAAVGRHVEPGDVVAEVGGRPVIAQIPGVLRGLIHPAVTVEEGMKIGDVDPRDVGAHCFSIADKPLALGGGVLEAILSIELEQEGQDLGVPPQTPLGTQSPDPVL